MGLIVAGMCHHLHPIGRLGLVPSAPMTAAVLGPEGHGPGELRVRRGDAHKLLCLLLGLHTQPGGH